MSRHLVRTPIPGPVRNLIRGLVVAALLAPLPALAQTDCDGATQMEMNACAAAALARADDDLNAVYKQAALAANGSGEGARTLLLAAQRAWIAYRDAACTAEAAPYDGSSIQPMVRAGCLERLTLQRSADLRLVYLSN